MRNVNLVGTWKLLSAIARTPNEDTVYPFGENPFGRLMYDTNSNISVFIMRTGRSKFTSDDGMSGTTEEKKEAFEGCRAYCGTYEIDEDKGTVTHHIKGATFPNWEGTDQLPLNPAGKVLRREVRQLLKDRDKPNVELT